MGESSRIKLKYILFVSGVKKAASTDMCKFQVKLIFWEISIIYVDMIVFIVSVVQQ